MRAKDIIQTYYTSLSYLTERFTCFKLTAPCVLFLDELDILSSSIDASNYIAVELDKLKNDNVFVIGAIEHLDQLPTILLPPRLYRTICVPLPDESTRKQIFLANIISYDIDAVSKTHLRENFKFFDQQLKKRKFSFQYILPEFIGNWLY